MDQNNTVLSQRGKFAALSDRYRVITTQDIIERFQREGYTIRSTSIKRASKERSGFQGHLVRLQRGDLKFKDVGDSVPEIVLKNSYDGTSGVQIMLGIFRLVCSNGMITGSTFHKASVRHVGNALDLVMGHADSVIQQVPRLESVIQEWRGVHVPVQDLVNLELNAFQLIKPTLDAVMLNQDTAFEARRQADEGSDLWTAFNRIQERIIGGGIRYEFQVPILGGGGKIKTNTTRAIKSIDRLTKVNQALFDLASTYAKGA